MMRPRLMPAGRWSRWLAVGLFLGAVGTVACWPVETRFGVNYEWSSRQIRLYEKVTDFISRDLQTRRLVSDIVASAAPEQVQILAIFDWVGAHVRPTPNGFPVVDDHVLHIIIRGYGAPDQRTEAFALLASYAGMLSTATVLQSETGSATVVVSLVQIDNRVYVFDVINQVVFQDAGGALADVERLMAEPALIRDASGDLEVAGIPYERFFSTLPDLRPNFSRMEQQKPWYRATSEILNLFGAGVGR